jgi:EAL domain-containing protein (putative c-di-GMP-specific phosphodiesterase class I)
VAQILVVEPDSVARDTLLRGLRDDGHIVRVASNLGEARDILLPVPMIDAVVVNERQPDGDGITFMADLRNTLPRCARVLLGGQRVLSTMVRAVNTAAPHQVIHQDASAESKCSAVDSALLIARSAVDAAREPLGGPSKDHLHNLLEGPGFQLAIQPIIASQGNVFGYEGLIRTTDPLLPTPIALLQLAEKHGMLDHVLYAVATRARDLLQVLPATRQLFLNLHPLDLADPDELVRLLRPVQPYAQRVALEITGRAHTIWTHTLRERLAPLRTQGFTVGIDDLGAGDGALVLMAESTPGFIKAHDSIVRGSVDSPHKLRILEMLCHFAVGSRARVIAEGVEREEEARVLRSLGISLFQGYYFGKPSTNVEQYTRGAAHPT